MQEPDMAQLALKGLRVLEVGSGAALAYAGKIFADFGAEVIKVEPIQGDTWRGMPPLMVPQPGMAPESALFAWLNTNKRSVTADVALPAEQAWLGALARSCDVVLDARALSQGLSALQQPLWKWGEEGEPETPAPMGVDFTWFGDSGPYKDLVATDATCRALAGAVHGSGPAEGAPHMPHDVHTSIVAGLGAFSVTVAAWMGRSQGSRRYVLSVHEAAFSVVEMEAGMVQDQRHAPRLGVNRFCTTHPASILQTSDGWIGIFTNTLAQWKGLCEAIGRPELGSDARFFSGPDRMAHADLIDDLLKSVFPSRSTQEWFELLTAHKHPAVIVPSMAQLLQQPVHRERKAFVPVQCGRICFEAPVLPQRLGAAGPLLGGRAPLLGADNAHYRGEGLQRVPLQTLAPATVSQLPLEGLRVVDLTMGWAGPFASRMLADLGAEVIKVESTSYPDWWRGTHYTEAFYRERLYEKNANFNLMNRGKLGITLDLTQAEGKRLLKELVRGADAVIENYSAEVLPKLGLDYAALRQVNPRVVMLSMPAFGLGNAWSNTRAYGGTLEQASGLPLYTGHADGPPAMTSYAYGDPIGGFNASAALLLGLLVQQEKGLGQHINLSQVEGMLPLTAPFLIEHSLTAAVPERQGNRHPLHAPHGCYPCAGHDAWLVLSVENNGQWQLLCRLLGRSDWAQDPGLHHASGRRTRQAELDAGISAWTRARSDDAAMQALQQLGLPAGAVRTLSQLLRDVHLQARGFWQTVERPFAGQYISSSTIFRQGGRPMPMARVAPTLGEHTREVLQRLLQLTPAQLQQLEDDGVIGSQARAKEAAKTIAA
jgi:crotonobetainyl-CoA:carnitine CoA-transferase CaiB-like acyl-CoA transferase